MAKMNPAFLFELNMSSDKYGKYFDGEDPYRLNFYEYYAFNPNDMNQYRHIKQIYAVSEYGKIDPIIEQMKQNIADNFAKTRKQPVIVLRLEWNDKIPIIERMKNAVSKYETTRKYIRKST